MPGQPRPNGYTILRAPPHRGGLRFGSSQRASVPQAISHNDGDVTGASQAGSGSFPVLRATMAPGTASFSDVALEATEEQEALAVAFLSECTVGETVLNAYDAAYDQETKCRVFLSTAESAIQRASRLNKPLDCWGCGGNHFWNQCPKKSDPDTRRRVNQLFDKLNLRFTAIESG